MPHLCHTPSLKDWTVHHIQFSFTKIYRNSIADSYQSNLTLLSKKIYWYISALQFSISSPQMCGWQYVGWDHISQGAPYHYATAQVEQRCLQLYMQMEQVDQRRAQDVEEVEGRHWWTIETCTRCTRCTRGTRGRIEAQVDRRETCTCKSRHVVS